MRTAAYIVPHVREWLDYDVTDDDVGGRGTTLTGFMRESERLAMVFGHSFVLMDRAGGSSPPSPALTRAVLCFGTTCHST